MLPDNIDGQTGPCSRVPDRPILRRPLPPIIRVRIRKLHIRNEPRPKVTLPLTHPLPAISRRVERNIPRQRHPPRPRIITKCSLSHLHEPHCASHPSPGSLSANLLITISLSFCIVTSPESLSKLGSLILTAIYLSAAPAWLAQSCIGSLLSCPGRSPFFSSSTLYLKCLNAFSPSSQWSSSNHMFGNSILTILMPSVCAIFRAILTFPG